MTTPRTPTGKRLYGWLKVIAAGEVPPPLDTGRLAILAIEVEAAQQERERLGSLVERNHWQRGHPGPVVECRLEECVLGWTFAGEPAP